MNLKYYYVFMLSIFLCSCGSGQQDGSVGSSAAATPTTQEPNSPKIEGHKSFVLCPALENYRAELAAIVGFEQDAERALALSAGSRNCFIRGQGGNFIAVERPPAFIHSIKKYVESFDGAASPAPELGNDAMFVDDVSQPRVIFNLNSLLIDVHAENAKTPDRQTMITLATRVREILDEAI